MDFSPSKFTILKKLFAKHSDCEIEARFGRFGKDKPGISPDQFDRIFNYFDKLKKHFAYSVMEQEITIYADNVKQITTGETDVFMSKNKEAVFDVRDYSVRICFSSERKADKLNPDVVFQAKRTRHSFVGEKIVVDLDIFSDGKLTCELELIQGESMGVFIKHLELILNIIQDSDTIVKNSECRNVITAVNKKFPGVQPIPVTHKKLAREKYSLTKKLDGQRGILISNDKDVYILHSNMKVKKTSYINNGSPFIMDGELFRGDFHVFDVITQSLFLPERLKLAEDILKQIECPKAKIYIKKFIHSDDLATDFNNMVSAVTKQPEIFDGIILVKTETDYENSRPLKWKPVVTIDFQIKKLEGCVFQFYCYDKNKLVLFQENEVHPDAFCAFGDGDIVECFLDTENRFVPMKVRHDKNRPNWLNVAKDNLENIKNPFAFANCKNTTNTGRFMHFAKRYVLDKLASECKIKSVVHLSCGDAVDTSKFVDIGFRYIELLDGTEKAMERKIFYNEKAETKNVVINVNKSDNLPIKVVIYEQNSDLRSVKQLVESGATGVSFGISKKEDLSGFKVTEMNISEIYKKWQMYDEGNVLQSMPWHSILLLN